MLKKYNIILKGFIPLFVLLAFAACKKEVTDIGLNLRPDGGVISGTRSAITDIVCRTVEEDSLRTDSLSTNIIGSINDPLFGESRASLVVQPLPEELDYDFSGASLDSVILRLKYERSQIVESVEQVLVEGDLDDEIVIDVYKLADDLDPSKRYYSNQDYTLGAQIGTYSGRFLFFDSVEVKVDNDTIKIAPELSIKLDASFGNEMLAEPIGTYASNDDFLNFLKGIVLVPRLNHASGDGAIVGVDARNSASDLTIYYNGDESKRFIFSTSSEVIGKYDIVNQPMDITNQKAGSGHFNKTYMQAMGGAKVKIDIPGLDSIIEKGEEVAILEAILRVKVDQSTIDADHKAPTRALLLIPNPDDGTNFPIIDFVDDVSPSNFYWLANSNYGGSYDASFGGYEFHFNRHLQSIIKDYNESGVNSFDGFYLLIPSDFPITPTRAVLDTDPLNQGIEVSVTYSKLN